jgi:hypothetical protein
LNIEPLLKAVHEKLKPLTEKFTDEGQIYYEDVLYQTEDSKEKDKIAEHLASFKRQAEQLDQVIMNNTQELLNEFAGDAGVSSSIFKVSISAEDLELVETEDLDQQVALDSMSSKAIGEGNVVKELNLLNQRLNKGFKREDIDDKSNPFGPSSFCASFGKAFGKLNIPPNQKLTLFRIFELNVLPGIESLLAAANENLISQGVLPNAEVVHKSSQPGGGSAAEKSEAAEESSEQQEAVPDLSEAVKAIDLPVMHQAQSGLFDINDPVIKQIYDMVAKEGYQVLEKLLRDSSGGEESRISSEGVGDQNFSGKQEIPEEELVKILDNLQAQASAKPIDDVPVLEGEFQKASVLDNIGDALKEKSQSEGVATTLSKAGNDKVQLVDMLFDHMLTDDYLPGNVKSIISELQVPLTKLALMDETFFSDQHHPGRLLLNELSRTGMSVNTQGVGNDQSIKLISGTVKQVQESFKTDSKEIEGVLVDLSENLTKQNKKIDVLEKRLMDAEKGQAKTEHAQDAIASLYDMFRARVPVPTEIDNFLDTAWHDVLMMTCLKFGSHSKQWKSDKEITVKFMKSILLAKRARLDSKQMKIPMSLLKVLKQGLDRISYDPLETKRLLGHVAKVYQAIAATSPDEIQQELLEFGGEVSAAKKAVEKKVFKTEQASDKSEEDSKEGASEPSEEQDILKSVPLSEEQGELSEEEKAKLESQQKLKEELQKKIEEEKEKIAAAPKEAIEEKIKNLDQDLFVAAPEIKELEPENEFVEGNTWYDMVSSLPIGAWLELDQQEGEAPLRCKLVANIKSLQKLIFVNKAGAKVADKKMIDLAKDLKGQKARVINDNTIFDQALENVIVNLRGT